MISCYFLYTAFFTPHDNAVRLSVERTPQGKKDLLPSQCQQLQSIQWGRCGIPGARDQEDKGYSHRLSPFSHFRVFSLGDDATHIRGCHPLVFFGSALEGTPRGVLN